MATLDGSNMATRGGSGGLQIESFTVTNPAASYSLVSVPAQDADGDPVMSVKLNGLEVKLGVDFTLSLNTLSWISGLVSLEVGDQLEVFYQPL